MENKHPSSQFHRKLFITQCSPTLLVVFTERWHISNIMFGQCIYSNVQWSMKFKWMILWDIKRTLLSVLRVYGPWEGSNHSLPLAGLPYYWLNVVTELRLVASPMRTVPCPSHAASASLSAYHDNHSPAPTTSFHTTSAGTNIFYLISVGSSVLGGIVNTISVQLILIVLAFTSYMEL